MGRRLLAATLAAISLAARAAPDTWVTVDNLNRRTCPASTCGVVGQLIFREKATVLEQRGGWARITEYYDPACIDGISKYVDSGNEKCVAANGISDGKLAEWVATKYLSRTRPEDPARNAAAKYDLVMHSDDFRLHKDAFAEAANKLIEAGRCSRRDFNEMGGWMKSNDYRNQPVYFTYCGGMRLSNKIYLNAATGEILR